MVIHCLWLLAAVDEDRTRLTGRLTLYFFSSPDFSKARERSARRAIWDKFF